MTKMPSANCLSIPEWYAKKHVFITGATGFMGKVLVEKLIRCCPDIEKVYLLIRPKRGKSSKERLEEFLDTPVFDQIKSQTNSDKLLEKIYCINGDIIEDNMGINEDNLKMLIEDVSIFFHMAANVRFDQPLKSELIFNIKGTLNSLRLSEKMKKLISYTYVSTTFCHCDQIVLDEKFYPAPQEPLKMLDLISWLDEGILNEMTPFFLKNAPNTYAYSKCLSEQLVCSYADKFPIVVARPSIVLNAWKEPKPGWVDNLNGPTGIVVAAGKGVLRTMYCKVEMNCDGVPVDMAINSLIIIGKDLGESRKCDKPRFVNISLGNENCITWDTALTLSKKHFYENPFSVMLWYPDGGPKNNQFIHDITAFFTHVIPAYLIDFMLIIGRQKPFMVKVQKRIKVGLEVLTYYTTRDWYFPNDNLKKLREKLTPNDREIFYTDFNKIDWNEYFLRFILGARKYCLHEDPGTLPRARKTLQRLYYLNQVKNLIVYGLLFWFFYVCTTTIFDSINSIAFPTKIQFINK